MINIVTKGGGKNYAGTAYYFLRNEALNAANFFNNKAGLKRALYRFNYWGFNFGGPMPLPKFGEGGPSLIKGKAFFFFNLEKPHTITPTDPVLSPCPRRSNGGRFFKVDNFHRRIGQHSPAKRDAISRQRHFSQLD